MEITRAGDPPTMLPGGTSLVTTAPAATMALGPIVTPGRISTFWPIITWSRITILPKRWMPGCSSRKTKTPPSWVRKTVPDATATQSPISTR